MTDYFIGAGVFDASQYDFFGSHVVEEVELGGLEDEDEEELPVAGIEEDFAFDKDEVFSITISVASMSSAQTGEFLHLGFICSCVL